MISVRCFHEIFSEIPEKPERCNRGPPPAVKAKLEEAAAAIAAPGLCNAQAVHEWFKTTKETMQRTLMGQKRTLMEQIIAEVSSSNNNDSKLCTFEKFLHKIVHIMEERAPLNLQKHNMFCANLVPFRDSGQMCISYSTDFEQDLRILICFDSF